MIKTSPGFEDAFGGSLKNVENADFTIVGIPYDLKTTYRAGTSKGPDAIRKNSTVRSINSFSERGVDLSEDTNIRDAGNIQPDEDTEKFIKTVEDHIYEITKSGSIPVSLGGDHSVTYPVVKGVHKHFKELNIVWLDAHPDVYEDYEGDLYSHACPLARILELDGIKDVIQGGIRATTRKLNEKIKSSGIKVYDPVHFNDMHGLTLDGPVYLSIDIDVLDPAYAPGVGTPVPGGMTTRDIINFIHSTDMDIVGFDLVEVNPDFDQSFITASVAAKIIIETIAQIIWRKNR